jgi:predicted nucleic acid-binding protein
VSLGLLDTSVLIAHADAGHLRDLPDEGAISVATLAELHYGVLAAKNEEARQRRLTRLGQVEAAFQPIPIDAPVARAFARIAQTVRLAGRQPRARVMDLWIAATALAHGLVLYSRDRDAFTPLGNLIDVRIL